VPQTDPTYAPADLTPATWGRRILALFVDWVSCLAVVEGLVAVSCGKLATRVRVVRNDGPAQPVSLLRALLRSVLVALLIPPLLTFDGRGLHDLAAGTRTVSL